MKCVCIWSCLTLQHHGLEPTRLLWPRHSPHENTWVGCHSLLQRTFPTQGSNPGLPHCRQILYHLCHQGAEHSSLKSYCVMHVCEVASVVPSSATPWTVAHQAPPSMGFSRWEYWSGLPFPSPLLILVEFLLGNFYCLRLYSKCKEEVLRKLGMIWIIIKRHKREYWWGKQQDPKALHSQLIGNYGFLVAPLFAIMWLLHELPWCEGRKADD